MKMFLLLNLFISWALVCLGLAWVAFLMLLAGRLDGVLVAAAGVVSTSGLVTCCYKAVKGERRWSHAGAKNICGKSAIMSAVRLVRLWNL